MPFIEVLRIAFDPFTSAHCIAILQILPLDSSHYFIHYSGLPMPISTTRQENADGGIKSSLNLFQEDFRSTVRDL